MEGVDIFRLPWFAAPDLTLARPQAPQIARRAFGRLWLGQPMTTPMRTMRRKSSRFCALKSARTSLVNLAGITTGASSPDIEFLATNSPLRLNLAAKSTDAQFALYLGLERR
jgi:hypothetical protein